MSGWGSSGPSPDDVAAVVNAALSPYAKSADVNGLVSTAVPPAVAAVLPPPIFRFAQSGLSVGSVIAFMLADRPATLKSVCVVASALTSATSFKATLKKNGTAIGTAFDISTAPNLIDVSSMGVTIDAMDKITVEVTTMTLVVGLGTVFGFIKTS